MTTAALDAVGAVAMARLGVRSAPQMTCGFPSFTCISVNDATSMACPDRGASPLATPHGVLKPRLLRAHE